ncbi:hypothetical protein ACLKA6_009697 [Drosophila palustris]
MSRCLSQILIKYQREEEEKILKITEGLDEEGKKRVKELYEPLKITSDDLSREYSPTDVKQLCLRTKVRVDMTLFNCLWEAKKRFDKKGRLTNRSERTVNAMYKKAVQKKMVVPYSAKEIAQCNHIRQCQLKKENNARLDRWRRESIGSSVAGEPSLMMAQIPNESMLPNSNNESAVAIVYPESSSIQAQDLSIRMPSSEPLLWIESSDEDSENANAAEPAVANAAEPAVANDAEPAVTNDAEPDDASAEVTPDWGRLVGDINSESMTIDEDFVDDQSTPQTESQPLPNIPEEYNLFGTQVPCTSTQSQETQLFPIG